MTIKEYLDTNGLTGTAFAIAIGCTPMAVSRYTRGLRVPAPPIMRRIIAATGGQVTPNDFFADLEAA